MSSSLPAYRAWLLDIAAAHLTAALALEAELAACRAIHAEKKKEEEHTKTPKGWQVPNLWWVSGKNGWYPAATEDGTKDGEK